MRKIRWPEKMATSIDCPSFWYPVISYPGTVVSYPSLSRSVPKFESFRTQVWVVAYPIRWSIHTDINRCVQQISRVKRVRHKEKSVYLWPSRQKQYNYCLTQGKCDIFSWKVYRFYLSLFLTITARVSVIFFLQLLTWKTYFISLGTKRPSWVRNEWADWVRNDPVG